MRHSLFTVVFACVFALAPFPAIAADKPNVLLILVDDLKPSFGAYGVVGDVQAAAIVLGGD